MVKRKDFIDRLADKGYTKHDAKIIMEDMILTIREALAEGENVVFRGFGTFVVYESYPRPYVDQHTKEWKVAPSVKKPKFVPGKSLRRDVLEGRIRDVR